jgi:small conductance mechanosensitive channel
MAEWFGNLWETVKSTVTGNWHNILKFVLFLVIGAIVVKIALSIVRKMINSPKSRLKGTAGNFLIMLIKVALMILYVIILLSLLGVDTTSLVAIFSVLTLAISLAVQGVISNLASGIMLVVTKPFEEGDFVDIGGNSGTVEHIYITCTKLITGDNKVLTIPNSTITAENITNYTTKDTRRVDFTFSVAYGSDVEKVKAIIMDVVTKHEKVLTDTAPLVRLTEHGASSLDFVTRVWVKNADYWTVNFDLKEQVLAAFDEAGISVPFPQLDVHMVKD